MVSVIIPVYNAQKTLNHLMNSVLAQTYTNLEVLAVDDGSTDESLAILKRYARQDSRVRVFSQPNGGAASARNHALSEATGVYVQFCDSDDFLPPTATARLVAAMEAGECDMAIAPYVEVAGNARSVRGVLREDAVMEQKLFLHHFSLKPNAFFYAALWNKLYRRNIIASAALRFDACLPWGEDFAFNTEYYRFVRRVAVMSEPVYEYIRNPGGLALASVRLSVMRPAYSVRLKILLYRYYVRLYEEAGLYEAYRHVSPQYLFRVTIHN